MSSIFSTKHEEGGNYHGGGENVETVIGPSVKVEGTFQGQGDVSIEGAFIGTLSTTKDLTVGEQAKIEANVEAVNMHIAGEVRGNLKASGRIDLTATAKIYGDVESAVLSVASGAVVQGRCVSGMPPSSAETIMKPQETPSKVAKK